MSMMKYCAVLLVWGVAARVLGQIDVACSLPETRLMLYEPIRITVQIANHTSEDLQFSGRGKNVSIRFDVESSPGALAPALRDQIFLDPVVVPAGKNAERMVNLMGAYDLRGVGPYSVRVRIEWRNKVFLSAKVLLEIMPGMELDRMTMAIPGRSSELRTCSLRLLNRGKGDHLFLRLEDEDEGRCFGVFDLGRIVRLYVPKLKVDGMGHIHVLHQSGPGRYTHSIFTPDGVPLAHQIYTAELNAVNLESLKDGEIRISGIGRHEGASDFPPRNKDSGMIPGP